MNDEQVLTALRTHLTSDNPAADGASDAPEPVEAIIGRARRRTRRRGLVAGTGLGVAAVVLGIGVALPHLGRHEPTAAGPAGNVHQPVHVQLADWSVNTNADGSVTITIHRITDVALLRATLARAGVPAAVLTDPCYLPTSVRVPTPPGGGLTLPTPSGPAAPNAHTVTVAPAGIPAGAELFITVVRNSSGVSFTVAPVSAPPSCHN